MQESQVLYIHTENTHACMPAYIHTHIHTFDALNCFTKLAANLIPQRNKALQLTVQ